MSTRNKIRSRRSIVEGTLLAFLIIVFLVIRLAQPKPVRWPSLRVNHSSSMATLWKLTNIHIFKQPKPSGGLPFVSTLDDKLIFLGIADESKPPQVVAIDGKTGNIVWQFNYSRGNVIATSGSNVYVGGVSEVIALDTSSGRKLWSTRFFGGTVTEIVPKGDILYFDTPGSYYSLDSKNGQILQKFSGPFPYHGGVRSGDLIYWTTGEGDVKAEIEANGQTVWRKTVHAFSNLAVTPSLVYVLNDKGNIVRLDTQTGNYESFIQFEPSTMQLYSKEDDGSSKKYSYYIAVNTLDNLLFVYLGDSGEIFAFQLTS